MNALRHAGGPARSRTGTILVLSLAALPLLGAGYEWGGPAARAIRQLREGKSRDAVASFDEARRERPTSSAVRYDQALAFAASGSADSAAAAYRDARDLEGGAGRAAAAYNQGNAAYRDGKIDEAIADYRAALREAPKLADAKRNLEEALRRARASKESPLSGSGGSQGEGSGGTGARAGGTTPPPAGATNSPNDSKSDSKSKERPSLGAAVPNREEAEHWLDALEAERRAARSREQAAKRSDSRDQKVDRDW